MSFRLSGIFGGKPRPTVKQQEEAVTVESSVQLGDEQQDLFDALESSTSNYFVTGKAGTGKSVLLEYFAENTSKNVAIVAPTGVAALNVGGQTIHSFFKFAPILHEVGSINTVDSKTKEILQSLDALIIDEVSMVSADLLEAMSEKLKLSRRNDLPFGGVQMIMFGDLYQLSPVVSDGQAKRYLDDTFGGSYFFYSSSYKDSKVIIRELQTVFRQKDEHFKVILNEIRSGLIKDSVLDALNKRARVIIPETGFITLAGTNRTVNSVNSRRLAELPGEVKKYEAAISGDIKESSFPTEKILKLKAGAQVMMLKNDIKKPMRWVNGTLAVVTKLGNDGIQIEVNGVEHTILPASWDKIKYEYDHETKELKKKTVSSFQQIPVRLAWAVTIHKSQGQTYDQITIDLSEGAFAHGQTYVALSRCTSLEGLYLESPIRREDIIVDPDVIEFMKNRA
jgi:hypothetical protein